jgi:hypothetical protein
MRPRRLFRLLGPLGGRGTYTREFTTHLVLSRRVKDRNAELAVLVNVGMEERLHEAEGGRRVGVVGGECHFRFEVATIVKGAGIQHVEADYPVSDVFILQLNSWSMICSINTLFLVHS